MKYCNSTIIPFFARRFLPAFEKDKGVRSIPWSAFGL